MRRLREFLETRGGLLSAWRRFADEPTPKRRAWLFTLGSAALFVFLVQFASGLILALHYAPTPDHAHASVQAFERIPGGTLVRGLHHWGASAMVVLVVLHMARTFLFGAYRKPRELNWIVGVALLLLVLGFGLTGYLLPWDQKAYWATVVATKVPKAAPFGDVASRLMAGGDRVGALTLTRFYALHVVLLPLLLAGLVVWHLLLLRRHTHAGPTAGPDEREPFFPFQAARDAVVAALVAGALLWLAARHPAPLERLADPTDTTYVPRPDWYFLPLFQLLKYFEGPMEPVGTAVIPALSVLVLALVPWLDRGKDRRLRSRGPIVVAGGLAGAAVLALLWLGARDAPKPAPDVASRPAEPPPDPKILWGAASYETRRCAACHGAEGRKPPASSGGFALAGRPGAKDDAAIAAHVKERTPPPPTPAEEGGVDPDLDVPALTAYVRALSEHETTLAGVPPAIRKGGAAIEREDCRSCHEIFGQGGTKGPPLQHVAGKRDAEWLFGHFKEPKKFVPDSKMPSFRHLPEDDLRAMSAYLLALP